MSAEFRHQEPLPEEAKAALQKSGAHLLAQLEAMRSDANGEPACSEIEPLDPRAELALRRSGSHLLADLESRREALATGAAAAAAPTRRRWRYGAGIAASFALLLAAVQINTAPPEEPLKAKTRVKRTEADPLATSTLIPEPSSALLGIIGGTFLLYRRRR